jgi:hypothetical protein
VAARVAYRAGARPGERMRRPRTRGQCENDSGRCPLVSCRHNLVLFGFRGNLRNATVDNLAEFVVAQLELESDVPTCVLDVVDRAGNTELTLDEAGHALGDVSRERARQLEAKALAKLRTRSPTALRDLLRAFDSTKPEDVWERIEQPPRAEELRKAVRRFEQNVVGKSIERQTAPTQDLVGRRFGKLVVTERCRDRLGSAWFRVRCECGTVKSIRGSDLVRRSSNSCGCNRRKGKAA